MMEFIRVKLEDGSKIGLNIGQIVSYTYREEKGKEPTIKVYLGFYSDSYHKTFTGQVAKDLNKYLDSIGMDVPTRR